MVRHLVDFRKRGDHRLVAGSRCAILFVSIYFTRRFFFFCFFFGKARLEAQLCRHNNQIVVGYYLLVHNQTVVVRNSGFTQVRFSPDAVTRDSQNGRFTKHRNPDASRRLCVCVAVRDATRGTVPCATGRMRRVHRVLYDQTVTCFFPPPPYPFGVGPPVVQPRGGLFIRPVP